MAAAAPTALPPAPLLAEALGHFFDDTAGLTCTQASGGVNNHTLFIHQAGRTDWVLRIYNNSGNLAKVTFEHDILAQLNERRLSFAVPCARPCRAASPHAGRPFALLSNGAAASLFRAIPGALASTASPEALGEAAGELSTALATVTAHQAPPTPPYYDLYRAHHAIGSQEAFAAALQASDFGEHREAMGVLQREIVSMELQLEQLHALGLPHQLIHGDLHYDNVLILNDQVTAVLDYEFCALDWRAMELSIVLSKYLSEVDPLPFCAAVIRGFMRRAVLTEAEARAVPSLVKLRILSNVVYFMGRYVAGEDGLEQLTCRAGGYVKRIRWLSDNGSELVGLITQCSSAAQSPSGA